MIQGYYRTVSPQTYSQWAGYWSAELPGGWSRASRIMNLYQMRSAPVEWWSIDPREHQTSNSGVVQGPPSDQYCFAQRYCQICFQWWLASYLGVWGQKDQNQSAPVVVPVVVERCCLQIVLH